MVSSRRCIPDRGSILVDAVGLDSKLRYQYPDRSDASGASLAYRLELEFHIDSKRAEHVASDKAIRRTPLSLLKRRARHSDLRSFVARRSRTANELS